jgi:Cu/Ag efflux pump CusA
MLRAIVQFSIRFRGLVIAVAMVTSAYGMFRLSRAGLDIFPEFSPKAVIVQTESPGLSTEQVEVLVTRPIENALAGLVGLDYVRSESIQGLSVVTAVFMDDTNVHRNRQLVAARLTNVRRDLPATVDTPVTVPLASASATVRTIGIRSDRFDFMELRTLVDTVMVPKLLSIPGVADVNVFGGERASVQVRFDPDKLERFGVTIADLARAVRR